MALTARERNALAKRIADFLELEFAPVLAHYYARAATYASKHPQNINNELRNAVTHMSRALCAADQAAADQEMEAARRHVERFKRDCLKVTVVYASQDLGAMIRNAEMHSKKIDPDVLRDAAAVVIKRYEIIMAEVRGDNASTVKWEALLLDIEKLRQLVLTTYPILDPGKYGYIIWAFRLWRAFRAAATFLVASILAVAIGAAVIPDSQDFGEKVQKLGVRSVEALFPARPATTKAPG